MRTVYVLLIIRKGRVDRIKFTWTEITPSQHLAFQPFSQTLNFTLRFNEELVARVKSTIRQRLSARHVPEIILETKEIPYTASGKKVEVAVKRILAGEHIQNRGALANPNSLDLYYGIAELNQR